MFVSVYFGESACLYMEKKQSLRGRVSAGASGNISWGSDFCKHLARVGFNKKKSVHSQ